MWCNAPENRVVFGGFGNPLGPGYPASYADAIPTLLALHQIQISQEVRLASANFAAPLAWLGGFFYSKQRDNSSEDTYAITAPMKPLNSGCVSVGFDLNSGWNCTATNQG